MVVERVFVVGDAHGHYRLVWRLLQEAGIVDADGNRIRDPAVGSVHLGDLINGTKSTREDDAMLLRLTLSWFDVNLIGNHEYPYLGGYGFKGFYRDPMIEALVDRVSWSPSLAVGDTLLTHAGVADLLPLRARNAHAADVAIVDAWLTDRQHPFFALCSPARAGATDYVGGILWKDFREPRSRAFSQVHGHTPQANGPVFVGDPDGVYCANIDVGARSGHLAGVWLDKDGRPGEIVEAFVEEPSSDAPADREESVA